MARDYMNPILVRLLKHFGAMVRKGFEYSVADTPKELIALGFADRMVCLRSCSDKLGWVVFPLEEDVLE